MSENKEMVNKKERKKNKGYQKDKGANWKSSKKLNLEPLEWWC